MDFEHFVMIAIILGCTDVVAGLIYIYIYRISLQLRRITFMLQDLLLVAIVLGYFGLAILCVLIWLS